MSAPAPLKLLIFGGSGVLGNAIAEKFKLHGYKVIYGVRTLQIPLNNFSFQ